MVRRVMLSGGVEQTVTKPIIITVVKDVLEMLQLKNIYVRYGEESLVDTTDGIATASKSLHNTMLTVNMVETPSEGLEVSKTPFLEQTKAFYFDKENNTSAYTIYRSMDMRLELNYKSKSKAEINSLTNKLGLMVADDSFFNRHSLHISYEIPKTVGTFIGEVYKLVNDRTPIEQKEYTEKTVNMDMLDRINSTSGSKEKSSYVLRERHEEILGFISGDIVNVVYDKEDQHYAINFTYSLSYSKPIGMHIEFPILINNRTLPECYTLLKNKPIVDTKHFKSHEALEILLTKYSTFGLKYDGGYLIHPPQDEFRATSIPNYSTIMSLLLMVGEEKRLFNLRNLGGISFKNSILKFMHYEGYNIGVPHESLFFIALTKNGNIDFRTTLYVDGEGYVCCDNKLDIKSIYRVVIYVNSDSTSLTPNSRKRVTDYLNKEIQYNMEVRGRQPFLAEEIKASYREKGVIEGVEKYDNDVFLDCYFSFFKVPDETLINSFSMVPSISPADVLFRIKLHDSKKNIIHTMFHHTDIKHLFKEL